MSIEQHAKGLESPSAGRRALAALSLRSYGSHAEPLLPRLYEVMRDVDWRTVRDPAEASILFWGCLTAGTILHAVGFDENNDLHQRFAKLLIDMIDAPHLLVAGHSIHALGELREKGSFAIPKLIAVLEETTLRPEETQPHTFRSTALRMLLRISPLTAKPYLNTIAGDEYLESLEKWLSQTPLESPQSLPLLAERKWLLEHRQC